MTSDVVSELQAFQLAEYTRRAFECNTRGALDELTRRIWRRYGRGNAAVVNAVALGKLQAQILECRAILVARIRPKNLPGHHRAQHIRTAGLEVR